MHKQAKYAKKCFKKVQKHAKIGANPINKPNCKKKTLH